MPSIKAIAPRYCKTLIIAIMPILNDTTIALLLYVILGGIYLFVVPLALYFWLQKRWYVASSFERAFLYFLVFFFFPGMLVLAPFLNFRPKRREINI